MNTCISVSNMRTYVICMKDMLYLICKVEWYPMHLNIFFLIVLLIYNCVFTVKTCSICCFNEYSNNFFELEQNVNNFS